MKTTSLILRLTSLAAIALVAGPANAAITYVDAVEGASGNTFATGGSLGATGWVSTTSTAGIENQWAKRTDVGGNDTTIFQAQHETVVSDDMPELTTQLTGLADGTYEIWAFYWDQVDSDTQNWTLSTGFTSGSLTSYSSPGEPAVVGATTVNVTNAASLTFTSGVLVQDGFNGSIYLRNLFGVKLGEATVSGGSTVNVYVDNLLGNGSSNRTWYDGVGFELVPEPSSAALLGLGCLALLRRRRK